MGRPRPQTPRQSQDLWRSEDVARQTAAQIGLCRAQAKEEAAKARCPLDNAFVMHAFRFELGAILSRSGGRQEGLSRGVVERRSKAVGTSNLGFPTTRFTILTFVRPTPTRSGLLDTKSPLLGRRWANIGLHCTAQSGASENRDLGVPWPTPRKVWSRIVNLLGTGWAVKRAVRRDVKTQPLLRTPLDDPSVMMSGRAIRAGPPGALNTCGHHGHLQRATPLNLAAVSPCR